MTRIYQISDCVENFSAVSDSYAIQRHGSGAYTFIITIKIIIQLAPRKQVLRLRLSLCTVRARTIDQTDQNQLF